MLTLLVQDFPDYEPSSNHYVGVVYRPLWRVGDMLGKGLLGGDLKTQGQFYS